MLALRFSRAVLALAVVLALPTAGWAQAGGSLKGRTVTEIVVKGNQNTHSVYVLAQMRTKAGRLYDADVLDADVKQLYKTGYFNDVETRVEPVAGGVQVTLIVVENQVVSRVVFEGRTHIQRNPLLEVIHTSEGTFLDPADLNLDCRAIEKLYRSKGYYHVSVTTERKKVADGVDVTFQISEGPRVSINKLQFSGNNEFDDKKLRKLIKTKQSFWILSMAYYDEDQLQSDVINLRRFYRDEGFLDVKVDLEEVALSDDKKHIDVVVTIEEGERYRVHSVEILGLTLFSADVIAPKLKLQPESFFRTEDLIADRNMIRQALGDAGYVFADIGIQTKYLGPTPEIDVTLKIDEKQEVELGRILITGNEDTKDKVIRRDLEVYPHERASLSRLERSVNRLQSRDYYETVTYRFEETEDPRVRDLIFDVEEKPTGKAKFGVGLTSNQGLLGQMSISKANFDLFDIPKDLDDILSGTAFTGAGQFALLELQPGTEVNRVRLSFQEPYLFDKPVSLTTGASYFRRDRDEYDEERLGANIAFGKRLTRDIGVELGYDWQLITIENIDRSAPQDILEVEGSNLVSSLRLSIGIDKRNNPFLTTKGFRGGITNELFGGPLGGDYDFYRVGANWSSYWTIFKDGKDRPFVLSVSARTGVMLAYSDTEETPTFERYYAGGSNSLLGFDFRGIGPMKNGDAIGGDAELLGEVAMTFPIYEKTFRGKVFLDAGSVEANYSDLFSTIRVAAGAGLQVFVPFLGPKPLEFNLAWALKDEPEDIRQIFSFSFGRDF